MKNEIKELKELIAVSLFISPCTEEELFSRDFLKNRSKWLLQNLIFQMEKDAVYYRGDVLYIYKSWAKENLSGYELDFSHKRNKKHYELQNRNR